MTDLEYSLISRAIDFSDKCHKDQLYGDVPFITHPTKVAEIVRAHVGHLPPDTQAVLIAAAYCHDILEDCKHVSFKELESATSEEVADVVYNVTNELGRNRKERWNKTFPKIKNSWKAVIVKLADRIANSSSDKGSSKYEMYKKEYLNFRRGLYGGYYRDDNVQLVISGLWDVLDKLYE